MSQVKIQKLATGGTFIIDGQEISGDNAINAVRSYLGETTGGIMDALREGQTVNYNSANNTVNITNSNGQSLTDSYLPAGTKANVTDSRFRKDWGATFHTKPDQFKRELAQLRGVNVGRFNNTEKPVDLKALTRGSGWFYTKDKDGNNQYIAGPENNNRMEIIKSIRGYLEGDDDFRKGYKTDGWKQADIDALKNWVNNPTVSNDREGYWNGLFNRIQTDGGKNLTEADIQTLKLMGFDDNILAENSSTGISSSDRSKWNTAGFGGLADILGGRAHLNDDGSLSLNDGESWGWDLGDLSGRNIYFNDNFYKSGYGASGAFDPFRGLTLYNNRLYTLNNPTLAKILNAENGFNTLKDAGDWEGADNIILTRFTDAARENPGEFRDDRYSEFLSDHPEYRFTNLTGLYDVEGLNPGEQLIQLYNLDTPLQNNSPYREYAPRYVVLDSKGKWLRDYNNFAGRKIRGASAKDLITYNRVTPEMGGNSAYAGRYYEDILGKNNEPTGYRVYYNPQNPDEDMILHMPGINAMGVEEDQDIKVPVELGKILIKKFQDKDFLERLIGNAQNKKDFQRFMSELVQSWFRQDSNNDFSRLTWTLPFTETNRKKWKDLGFKGDKLDEVIAAWKNAKRNRNAGNREERRYKYLVTSPNIPQEKNGGVIKKFQFGGVAGGSTNIKADTAKRVDVKNTNPKNAAGITEIGGSNWTDADTLELGALTADLGSLVLALTPGTNVASAAVGAASSTARLAADKKRGTKGAGWNYLLNLGMDAATLLPLLGAGAKGAKTVTAVKKALPTIIKAASVYGLGSAVVNSAKKIANGEKWTVRDVSTVLNALTAGVGLSKQGGLGRSTKTTKTKGYSESFKVGETEVTLNNKQITDIMESSNQTEALKNAIKAQAKNASKEEINAALDKLLKSKQTIWQRIRGKEGDVVLNIKKKPNTSVEQLEAIEGRPLYNWWHGLGDNRAAYNARIVGDKKAWGKANLIKTTGGQKSTQTYWDGKSWKVVKQTQKAIPDGGWAYSSVQTSPGSTQSLLPAPISSQLTKVPTYSMQTRATLEPALNTRTVTRGKGIKLNKNRYNLYDYQYIYVPQWINPFTKANYQSNVDKQPSGAVYQPSYKNGGKIIKAQTGLRSRENWLQKNNVLSSGDLHTILNNEIAHPKNNTVNAYNSVTNSTTTYQGPSIKQNYLNNNLQYKADTGDQSRGGFWGNEWMLNKPNVDDAIRAAITARAIYHDRDLQRMALGKLYQRQFQTPQFDTAKYNYSDIEQGFNESAKPLRERKFVSSDLAYNLSDKHQTEQQLSELLGQKNAQLTQRFNQIGDINRQINAQNETNRIQTANTKSQYLTNLNYQDAMLNSVIWNRLFSDVVNPFGQQMSQQGRDAWNKDLGMNYQFDAQNAQRVENARIQGDLNREFMSNWNALSDAEKKQYGDLETYVLTTNPERYKEIINGNPMYRSTMENIMHKYSKGIGAGMLYYKSGGSTVNIKNTSKNQRPAQEQIAINGHKAAKRSVDELSKALLSMLKQLQAMK